MDSNSLTNRHNEISDISREDSLAELVLIRDEFEQCSEKLHKMNEAETRLLLIDRVLTKMLGWNKETFKPETYVSNLGYIDYLLSIEDAGRIVVEAKRAGNTFSNKPIPNHRNHYQLSSMKSTFGRQFTDVYEQAKNYAVQYGVQFAVLTNGSEWFLVQAVAKPGFTSQNQMKGIYFGNIFSEGFALELFWNLLSRNQVAEGTLESYLAEINRQEADFTRIPSTQLGNLKWLPVGSNRGLDDFYDYFFDDITDKSRRHMLENCFVEDTQRNQFAGELERTLRDSAPQFADATELSPAQYADHTAFIANESGDQSGKVVLITGSVGCGKSTFATKVLIKHRNNLSTIVINLKNEIERAPDVLEELLWDYLWKEWQNLAEETFDYEFLKEIFHKDIEFLKRGPRSNIFKRAPEAFENAVADLLDEKLSSPSTYFEKCWRTYRRQRGILVFFDNVDKFSQEYQRTVYQFAHKLAELTGATIIITMREFTFFRGREAGFLDVRRDKVLHLIAPDFQKVVSRRVNYIEDKLNDDHRLRSWRKRPDWKYFQRDIEAHAQMLKRALLQSPNAIKIMELLEAISWHDTRYFLGLLKQVHFRFGSQREYWDYSEILGALMVPFLDFRMKPAIGNLFIPPFPKFNCYFLKIRIILYMLDGIQHYEMRSGSRLGNIIQLMNLYGYNVSWTKDAVQELVRERFLECLEAPVAEDYTRKYKVSEHHSYRPSPLAIVLVRQIITHSFYLSLLGNTLPFHDMPSYTRYEDSVSEVYEALDNKQIQPEALDLFVENNLSSIVSAYLVSQFESELAPESLVRALPNMAGTEESLHRIISEIKAQINLPVENNEPIKVTLQPRLPLDMEDIRRDEITLVNLLPIPEGITEMRIENSSQGPLVFWALAMFRHNGKLSAYGVEITNVINRHLIGDQNPKAPNNISRALRNPTLQSQPWLITNIIGPRKKAFGIVENWKEYWDDIFGEPYFIDSAE